MARGKLVKPKGKPERYGQVTLKLYRNDNDALRYYGSYWSAAKGRVLEKYLADNREDARKEAKSLDDELEKQKNDEEDHKDHRPPTIQEAIAEAIKARQKQKNLCADHVKNLLQSEYRFRCFMDERFPYVKHWRDVRRVPHVRDFVEQLESEKLKAKTIRHILGPVSLTAKYFARTYEEHGYRNLYIGEVMPEPDKVRESDKKFLTGEQLEHAIEVAESTGNDLALLALFLGGWSGMNLMEICKLKQRDFDFVNGTVSIGQNGAKNKYRERMVPLPDFVQDAVKGILYRQDVIDVEGSLVNVPDGLTDRIHQTLSRPIHRLLKKAGLREVCSAKDLRKTFINLAVKAGCEREILRRYVGHVPSDVLSENYEEFASRFPAEIVGKITDFRTKLRTELRTGNNEKAVNA